MRAGRAAAISTVMAAAVVGASTLDARAFSVNVHEGITAAGLFPPSGQTLNFLRPAVFDDVADQHEQIDGGLSGARDERHFDDCEFNGAAEFIRDRYADIRDEVRDDDPWDATDEWGDALHPVQDVYAHSNWVELGFPLTRDRPSTPGVDVGLFDLLDLSGSRQSLAQSWFAPAGGETVRTGILLGADDWRIPRDWSIDPDGGGHHVPTLIDPQGRTVGRLLVTGEGTADDECDVSLADLPFRVFDGFEHDDLNKDSRDGPNGRAAHDKAVALATLQTGYEWCRLVRQAASVRRDGLVLATWVRPSSDPHPAGTPCAPGRAGTHSIAVTIEAVRVLDSGDDNDNDPGEIQLAAALYDNPRAFHRSVHTMSRGGRVSLDDGDWMPASRLPEPLALCVGGDGRATFALHGWDNDDDGGLFANDFDDKGDDDELLTGFQRRFGRTLPSGTQVARSSDLEVRYRVSRTLPGRGPGRRCAGNLPADPTTAAG